MWKNKSLAAILLAFTLFLSMTTAASADSELISPDLIRTDSVSYDTVEVDYGDVAKVQTCGVSEYYPISSMILYQGKQAVFVKQISERTGDVKAGDKIIELSVIVDEVGVAEKELKLQRTKEELQSGTEEREQAIADMAADRESASDTYSYQKQTVKIQIAQVQLEQFTYQKNAEIEALEKELEELYADREPYYVTAPIDGKISGMTYYHEGDIINTGDVVCKITDESYRMVRSLDTGLRFGAKATVMNARKSGSTSMSGRVVMSSAVVPGVQGFSLIEIDDVEQYTDNWMFLTCKTNAFEMKNVLIIPNDAREEESKVYYATILGEDNVLHRREIKLFLSSQTDSWVLSGLKQGDRVITD